MYIEGIVLDNFIATTQLLPLSTPQSHTGHAIFRTFLSYDNKQYASTTAAHRNVSYNCQSNGKILSSKFSTTWENTYGCADKY